VHIRSVIIGGIVASLVIGMWEMIVEAILPNGAGFFGPVVAIGATVVRDLQGSSNPIPFDGVAFILGLAGHMMNSVVLAAVFGLAASRFLHGGGKLVAAGVIYGIAVWAAMWFVVIPLVDPLMLNLNGLVFLIGHMMWGGALGLLWSRFAPHAHENGSPVSA
jgi:uncharacterized membrane protein YagU involved in acid resistance